jgi:hypothetical protein
LKTLLEINADRCYDAHSIKMLVRNRPRRRIMSNSVVSSLHGQLRNARQVLEGTMEGVTAEQAHWSPPGKANPLGATYAHIVLTVDGMVNGMIGGAAPLYMSANVGISESPPGPDPDNPGFPNWSEWSRSVQVDMAAIREYAQAVYAASDECLASLTDEDLARTVDLSAFGVGEQSSGDLLGTVIANTQWHTGEISCLKGIQGLKGYPF